MGTDRKGAQRKTGGRSARRNDRARRPPVRRRAEGVRRLHRTAGNQAVLRLIQAASTESRLRVGPQADRLEQEAESVADSAVRRAAEEQEGEARARSVSDGPENDVQRAAAPEAESEIQRASAAPEVESEPEIQRASAPEVETWPESGPEVQRSEEAADAVRDAETADRAAEAPEDGEVRRAPEAPVQDEEVRRDQVAGEEEAARRQSEIHEGEEPKGGGVRLAEQEDEEPVRRKASQPGARKAPQSGGRARMERAAARAVRERGPGEALDRRTRGALESSLGADLGTVRVHRDARAQEAARALRARAFTHRNHIWLGAGQSPRDLRLMAHEAAHVVQQGAAGRKPGRPRGQSPVQRQADPGEETVQRDAAPAPPAPQPAAPDPAATGPGEAVAGDVAPVEVELKDRPGFEPGPAVADWLDRRPGHKGPVRVRFGDLARGTVEVEKRQQGYRIPRKGIALRHPVLERAGGVIPGARPVLVLSSRGKGLEGHVGLQLGKAVPAGGKALAGQIRKHADLLGLAGFQMPKPPAITNRLDNGRLVLELKEAPIRLGQIFEGTLTVRAEDGTVTSFEGTVAVSVPGLATGNLDLKRNDKGQVTGKTDLEVTLAKQNLSGKVSVAWDGRAVEGEGKLGYQGEKLSGSITLNVMEKAAALEREKQAAAGQQAAAAPAAAQKEKAGGKPSPGAGDYLLFGQGELDFRFTDWLTGKASVVVDPKGHTTIVGEITPQKEFELFPQKDYTKKLFKIEARASYGIPVVGNIFIFANIGMDAVAKLGPAKFYNIKVAGTYSTDPEKSKDFSIRGSLNISAFAGLRLRGEAGAGLEILAHDIKAGAGINALAGIRGYAEATPTIGYREKGAGSADKKGEFFIRGDLEIAAQPFLGLSGDLFVEIDAPWWSPVPDKKWTWPLGGMEYPLGGSFGLGASVDYVFGSGKAPALDFKPVEFSSDKFLTDLYSDKAKSKSGKKEAPGKWKEKNAKTAEPPPKTPAKGAAKEGKAAELPAAKSKVRPGGPKKAKKPVDPNARTADGKSVKEYKKQAAAKGKKKQAKDPKKATEVDEAAALKAVGSALKARLPKGARRVEEVSKVLSGVARQAKPALTRFRAEEVSPGKSKAEGAIGFKVKARSAKGKDVLVASVRFSKAGAALSPEERWEIGVKGVKKSVAKLAKRGISEETIKAQFPKWRTDYGFRTLILDAKPTPWVIEGEMSPGKPVAKVAPTAKDADDFGVARKDIERRFRHRLDKTYVFAVAGGKWTVRRGPGHSSEKSRFKLVHKGEGRYSLEEIETDVGAEAKKVHDQIVAGMGDNAERYLKGHGRYTAGHAGRGFSTETRNAVNEIGYATYDHSNSSIKKPGTKPDPKELTKAAKKNKGDWVPDHQPPDTLGRGGANLTYRFYPHSVESANKQGGVVGVYKKRMMKMRDRGEKDWAEGAKSPWFW